MNISMNGKRKAVALLLATLPGWAAADTMPASKQFGATTYVSGGVTADEAQAMKSAASRYNLHLVFLAHTGQYLAAVPVTIRNERGEIVLEGISDGPMLWAQLRPGRYVVTANYGGRTVARSVEVAAQRQELVYFRWQVATDSDL